MPMGEFVLVLLLGFLIGVIAEWVRSSREERKINREVHNKKNIEEFEEEIKRLFGGNIIDASFKVISQDEVCKSELEDDDGEAIVDEDSESWAKVEDPNGFGRPESLVEQDRRAYEDYVRELREALASRRAEHWEEH